ncbi:hypothetical protein OROGR_011353 [Orobanche gracilis]
MIRPINLREIELVVLLDLSSYSKKTIKTNEEVKAFCVIGAGSPFALSLKSCGNIAEEHASSQALYFITVGEQDVVRIWSSESAVCIFEQSMHEDVLAGVFISALMVANKELLCVTADQEFLFYLLECKSELLELNLTKRLVGYSKGVNDMKFIGIDEKFIAVAANIEQFFDVRKIVLCLDTCVSSSGTLVGMGNEDHKIIMEQYEQ